MEVVTTWPRGRPPPLIRVHMPDGRTLHVGADLARTLVHLRGGRVAPAALALLLAEKRA